MGFPVLAGRDGHGEGGWEKVKRVEVRGVQTWDGSWRGAVDPVTLPVAPVYVNVEGEVEE